MNPIYDEYIKFLRDMSGEKLPVLKEGYFWLNRQIIKGFDKQGNIHKFYKVVVSNDLEKVEIKKLKTYYIKEIFYRKIDRQKTLILQGFWSMRF